MLTDDITMVICPGIGNHSEKHYIRTFVDYSQKQGYRCAVLNHLGALPNVELTSPRMFTYGKTSVGVIKYLLIGNNCLAIFCTYYIITLVDWHSFLSEGAQLCTSTVQNVWAGSDVTL